MSGPQVPESVATVASVDLEGPEDLADNGKPMSSAPPTLTTRMDNLEHREVTPREAPPIPLGESARRSGCAGPGFHPPEEDRESLTGNDRTHWVVWSQDEYPTFTTENAR
jgi:hypothetical protein